MGNANNYFDLLFAKRYFHLIVFKMNDNYSIQSFYKDSGFKNCISRNVYKDFVLEQFRIESEQRFYSTDEDYSVNGNGEAPYKYDIIITQIISSKILIIGFPFKFLAKSVIQNLLDTKKLLSFGSFLRPDLNKLIKLNHTSDFIYERFSTTFNGLELKLIGDANITSVNLDGDSPLESVLYKTVFFKLVNDNECRLEKCALKSEIIKDISLPKTKSIFHVDLYGNFKMYIHSSGNNIFTIPFTIDLLENLHCFHLTLTNPIDKLNDE